MRGPTCRATARGFQRRRLQTQRSADRRFPVLLADNRPAGSGSGMQASPRLECPRTRPLDWIHIAQHWRQRSSIVERMTRVMASSTGPKSSPRICSSSSRHPGSASVTEPDCLTCSTMPGCMHLRSTSTKLLPANEHGATRTNMIANRQSYRDFIRSCTWTGARRPLRQEAFKQCLVDLPDFGGACISQVLSFCGTTLHRVFDSCRWFCWSASLWLRCAPE